MPMTISIFVSDEDIRSLRSFVEGVEKRAARNAILPILKRYLEPLVASERSFLSGRSKSSALVQSLTARAEGGRRDRPDTMSAFSTPSATTSELRDAWSRGRRQQRGWAAKLKPGRKRRRVFYGPIVHQGHRIVVRNEKGELVDTGRRTVAVPFAQQAMDALGESQSELAANEIMDRILGE